MCPHSAGFYFDLPDEDMVVASAEEGPCAPVLSQVVAGLRERHEIVDAYVRHRKSHHYTPLRDLAPLEGQWAFVVRPRKNDPSFRLVGIMLAKDEADAIPEVTASLRSHLDALYYRAGDVATGEALAEHSPWARSVPGSALTDGYRQRLLQAARADAASDGDPRPMWVMVVQGDEIYHDALRQHVERAHTERATVMSCQVATFLLHESQRGWDEDAWRRPLAQRLTHYIWDFGEHTGFLDFPWIYYDASEHMRAHPRNLFPARWATARPVRKHYPFRSPEQARARIEDRLKTGWQPHYENYKAIFMNGSAAGRMIQTYNGSDFPEAER